MERTAFVVHFANGGVYAVCRTKEIAEAQKARGQRDFEETLFIQEGVPMCGWFSETSPHWERVPKTFTDNYDRRGVRFR